MLFNALSLKRTYKELKLGLPAVCWAVCISLKRTYKELKQEQNDEKTDKLISV